MKLTPEQKEARGLVKGIEKGKCNLPDKDKNILDWNMKELNAYIKVKTAGMNATKKLKWARDLDKKIKEEKLKRSEEKKTSS